MTRFDSVLAGMATSLLFALGPSVVWADDEAGQYLALGKQTFLEACAGCHGAEARGDGPMSELISVPVADLTGLSRRNEGVFPKVRAIYLIDGRAGLTAHGGPMPMFGGLLTGPPAVIDGPDGTPVMTNRRILAVANYLESIQE